MLPYGRKNPLPFPFSERSHIGNLRRIRKQGKGRSSKRKENRRLSFLFARRRGYGVVPAAGRGTLPPSADGESPSEVQRKTPRPSGANPLAQFVSPTQSVLKKLPPRQGRTRLRQFVSPSWSVQKIYTKRAAAPMQQLFSMQNLNRTGSKPKFPRRYARSPR